MSVPEVFRELRYAREVSFGTQCLLVPVFANIVSYILVNLANELSELIE